MYCKYCGAPIADDSKFCPSCGQNLMEESIAEEINTAPTETCDTTYETPEEPIAEEPACTCDLNTEAPCGEETPSFAEEEYNAQPTYDPFSGPAHPSVKKNIIRACVAVGIATVISIILMVVSIASIVKNGSLEEAFSAMDAYEEDILVEEEETKIPMDLPDANTVALGNAGNTAGNTINNGLAVIDGNGGAYYTDINMIYYRSVDNIATPITSSNGDSCTNLNIKDNNLYYIVNSNNNTKQDIVCFDLTSETETLITSLDETISYMMIYNNELFYATECNIMAMDLTTENTRTVYTAENTLLDVCVTENGIYFSREEDNGYYGLYCIKHNETTASPIEEGYYFCIDNGQIYSSDVDYTGCDTIYQKGELDKVAKAVYTFAEGTFITQMNVQNNILYCVTETEESNGNYTYALRIINLENGDELVVDKDFATDENPFYSPNVAGDYLFYYDDNFDFGIRVYEI